MKITGELLKNQRERLGLSIDEAALATKINTRILEAIEEGDVSSLPQKSFLRGFVRSYALYLKLDVNTVMGSFQEEMGSTKPITAAEESTEAIHRTSPIIKPSSRSAKTLAVVSIIVLIVLILSVKEVVEKYEREGQTPAPKELTELVKEKSNLSEEKSTDKVPEVAQRPQPVIGPSDASDATEDVERNKTTEENLATNEAQNLEVSDTAEQVDPNKEVATKSEPKTKDREKTEEPNVTKNDSTPSTRADKEEAPNKEIQKVAKDERDDGGFFSFLSDAFSRREEEHEEKKPEITRQQQKQVKDIAKQEAPQRPSPTSDKKSTETIAPTTPTPTPTAAEDSPPQNIAEKTERIGSPETPPDEDVAEENTPEPVPSSEEVILEALDSISLKYKIDGGKSSQIKLLPGQFHIFKGKTVALELSDGGTVNIIHNGVDRGVPGVLGKSIKLKYPRQ